MAAAGLLTRDGWSEADRPAALILTLTALIGLPAGLWVTRAIDPETYRVLALSLILALSPLLLARVRIPWLATRPGTAVAGTGAGLISGLSGAGGLTIALYALIRDLPARAMRGTLILYMVSGGGVSAIVFIATDVFTAEAFRRAALLAAPALIGVLLGRALFTPKWERFYKPFCLSLLVALASIGMLSQILPLQP